MKIIVMGVGYIGLTSGLCATKDGHFVCGVDISESKVANLNAGECPIVEPGLQELLTDALDKDLVSFKTSIPEDIDTYDLVLICVGTPSLPDGSHNMTYIAKVSHDIASALKGKSPKKPLTIAYRSTMRPGSVENMVKPIFEFVLGENADQFKLVYNPEFLREATAIADYFSPPKIVIGTSDGQRNPALDELYADLNAPFFYVEYGVSEITKFVDNAFHATKVTFANEIGRICSKLSIPADQVHEIFVSDTKLNISKYYLRPGGAFGGSCLPKDVRALEYISNVTGANTRLIDSLLNSNANHKHFLFELACKDLEPGSKVLLNGIAFKNHSDDLRESPLLDLAIMIVQAGHDLHIVDKNVKPKALTGTNLAFALAQMPDISLLMKDESEISDITYDLIVDARGNGKEMGVSHKNIVDIQTL